MPKTLFEAVKQVQEAYDLVSQYTSVDELKKAGLKKVFGEWENNSTVRSVKEGKTTFSKEFNYFRGFSPRGIPKELRENDQRVSDLEKCFGEYNSVRDPIDTAGKGAFGGALVGSIAFMVTTRREAIGVLLLSTASMGTIGGLIGHMDRRPYDKWLNESGKRAEYLDRAYNLTK